MSDTIYFPADEVEILIDHAKNADKHIPSFSQILDWCEANGKDWSQTRPEDYPDDLGRPAVEWVKDQGTYLMSNGDPRLIGRRETFTLSPGDVDKEPDEVEEYNFVVHGRTEWGLVLQLPFRRDPDFDDELWDEVYSTTREICGGDDFVEHLDVDTIPPRPAGAAAFFIEVDGNTMSYGWDRDLPEQATVGCTGDLQPEEVNR